MTETQTRPDFFLIISDQHAQRVAGCYGDSVAITPAIDRLANSGVVFKNAYCAAPICVPSRMAMLTGSLPHRCGCYSNRSMLQSSMPTFLHGLSAAGYQTVLIGRMHFVGPDQSHGFDERRVGDMNSRFPFGPLVDLGPVSPARGVSVEALSHSGPGRTVFQAFDDAVVESAIEFLEEEALRRRQGQRKPLCLVIGTFLPHPPFVCEPQLFEYFKDLVGAPKLVEVEDEHPFISWWRHEGDMEQKPLSAVINSRVAYYALVSELDKRIDRILKAIDSYKEFENNWSIYASDHGEQLGERGLWAKSLMYDTSTKVPLIFRPPRGRRRQLKLTSPVSLLDVGPTLLELAEGIPLPGANGSSLVACLTGENIINRAIISESYGGLSASSVPSSPLRMIRRGDWKLIYYHGFEPELFNLNDDPLEIENLYHRSEFSDIRSELASEVMKGWDPASIKGVLECERAREEYLSHWYRAQPESRSPIWPGYVDAKNFLWGTASDQ